MSWNIAKPGDQINGPVAVTGNLNVDSNTLFVDSANNRVGVLTASPTVPLDVVGDAKVSGNLTVDTNTLVVDASNNRLGIGTATPLSQVHSVSNIAAANHDWTSQFVAPTVGFLAASNDSSAWIRIATYNSNPTHDPYINFLTSGGQNWSIGIDNSDSDKLKVAMAAGFSGSNEFLTIDSSGNVGIGTTSPQSKLSVETSGIQNTISPVITAQSTGTTYAGMYSVRDGAGDQRGLVWQVYTANVGLGEKMRLDSSGNLGLGVTPKSWAASYKAFQLGSYSSIQDVSGFTIIGCNYYNDGADKSLNGGAVSRYLQNSGAHTWQRVNSSTANATIAFTDSMVLNDSGNLGLGVTPSAWSGGGFLELQSNRLFAFAGPVGEMLANAFYDGQWKFKTTAATSRYRQDNGSHIWYYSGSGTAGNVVTWTQAMTLFADGNLAIGTASNNGGVCVEDRYILVRSNNAKQFLRLGTDGSNDIYLSGAELLGITGAAGIRFSAGTGLPERLRIKSTGQVNFVGLASDPAGAAAGDVYYNTTTNKLKCYNGTTWNDLF